MYHFHQSWNLHRPDHLKINQSLTDLDVESSDLLKGYKIAVMITGSIAAYKAPNLVRALRRLGASIHIYLSENASRFVAKDALMWCNGGTEVITTLTSKAEHLSSATPFDLYLVAPASYQTINGFATGSAHTPILATLAAALGRLNQKQSEIILCPAMNGDMFNSICQDHLKKLQAYGVQILEPRWNRENKLHLPDEERICAFVLKTLLSRKSSLVSKKVLVTAGAIPVYLDGVRLITNPFTGKLGIEIAKYLTWMGADVHLILGPTHATVPEYLQTYRVKDLDSYQACVYRLCEDGIEIGIYSAGVADFAPKDIIVGKVSSDQKTWGIELVATTKIIQEVRAKYQDQYMVTFKYMENITLDDLFAIGRKRLKTYEMLVVNRGEEKENGEQVAYLMDRESEEKEEDPIRMVGKFPIAKLLVDRLNRVFQMKI